MPMALLQGAQATPHVPCAAVDSGPEVLFVETELGGENREEKKKGTESSGSSLNLICRRQHCFSRSSLHNAFSSRVPASSDPVASAQRKVHPRQRRCLGFIKNRVCRKLQGVRRLRGRRL